MKNIVITGSTRGIGLAMAKEFLLAGCHVTLSGRGQDLSSEAYATLQPFEGYYVYIPCNVQQKAALQQLWDTSLAQWGTIDIWINNAGQNTQHALNWNTSETCTTNVIQTNLLGMVFGSQIVTAGMIKQGHGAIYSMEGLAKELEGTGVIAGRLSPGMMLTDFITKTAEGDPSEVITDKKFKKVFNILADTPETVAKFFIPAMLRNTKNNVRIAWLTSGKSAWRFITAGSRKDRLI